MAIERALIDRQGDSVLECAIAELLEDGEIERHARRTRRIYHARRDAFCAGVERELGGAVSFRRPPGGMALWATVAPDIDVALWRRRAIDRGVYFMVGRQFTLDASPLQAARFGFALLDDRESAIAIRRLAASLPVRHPRQTSRSATAGSRAGRSRTR